MAFHRPAAGHHRAKTVIEKTGHSLRGVGHHLERRHPDYKEDKALIDKEIRRAFSEHDEQLHGNKKTRLRLAAGGVADGERSKSRGDRASRKKHSGTNVNIVVAPHPGMNAARPVPVPVPVGGPGGPPPMPPRPMPGPMPMPVGAGPMPPRPPMPLPPGAPGAMPMPMRKAGGRTRRNPAIEREAREEGESYAHESAEHHRHARGGRTSYRPPHMTGGAGSGEGRREMSREADYAGRDGRGRA